MGNTLIIVYVCSVVLSILFGLLSLKLNYRYVTLGDLVYTILLSVFPFVNWVIIVASIMIILSICWNKRIL